MKYKLWLVGCLVLSMLSLTARSAIPSTADFFMDPAISDVTLSPDGNFVSFLAKGQSGHRSLFISNTDDLKSLKNVVGFGSTDVVMARWVNNNRLTFTVRNMADDEMRSNWSQYAVNRDGSELTVLISGNSDFEQSNTGSNIKSKILRREYDYFDSEHDGSDDIIVSKYTYNNIDHSGNNLQLFRLNTKTHQLNRLVKGNEPENVKSILLDMNQEARVAVSYDKGRSVVSYFDPSTSEWSPIADFDYLANDQFVPAFWAEDQKFYVLADFKGKKALYLYDLKQRKLQQDPFLNVDGFDFAGHLEFDFAAKKMLGIHFYSDARNTVWMDTRFKEIQAKVDAILTQTINTITCGDCLTSHTVLITSASDHQPVQYYVFNPVNGNLFGLGSTKPAIHPEQMGNRDFYHFSARDGLSIPVYVTMPPGTLSTNLPTVVLVHGGPNIRGAYWEWDSEAQFLASRGYVVLQPEFRGSEGFGFEHFQKGWKNWGMGMQDDLADAAKWAVAQGWSDPKRIAIAGASYGGYATLMGLIKNPDIFRCGFEWLGVTDIDLMFNTPQSDASQEALHYGMKTLIGDPEQDAASFRANSPQYNAARLKQPVLMAYGVLDRRVPIVHGTEFRDTVAKSNSHVEWVQYVDEGHGWHHEENRIDFWNKVETFLDKNLK